MTDELEFYYGQPTPDTDIALAEPVGANPAGTVLHDVLVDFDDRIAYLESTDIVVDAFSAQATIKKTGIVRLLMADGYVRGTRVCTLHARAFITDATTHVFTEGSGLAAEAEINDDRRKVELLETSLKTLCTTANGEQVVMDLDLHTGWGPVRISADVYFSMSVNFMSGTTTWRIRRDSIAGAVVATNSVSVNSLDVSAEGWKRHLVWDTSDESPTTGRYVLTAQTSASTIVSAQRYFSIDNTFALTTDAVIYVPQQRYTLASARITDATTVVFTDTTGLKADAFFDQTKSLTADAVLRLTPRFARPRRFLADAQIIRPVVSTTHGTSLTADALIMATVAVVSYSDDLFMHVICDEDYTTAVYLGTEALYNTTPMDPESGWPTAWDDPQSGWGRCARYYSSSKGTTYLKGSVYEPYGRLMDFIPAWSWYPSYEPTANPPIRWQHGRSDAGYTYRIEFDFFASIAYPDRTFSQWEDQPNLGPYVTDFLLLADDNWSDPNENILLGSTTVAADGAWHHIVIDFDPGDEFVPIIDGKNLLELLGSGPYLKWRLRDPVTDLLVWEDDADTSYSSYLKLDFRLDNVRFIGWPRGYRVADTRSVDGVTELSSVRFTADAVIGRTMESQNIALNPDFSRLLGKTWWYPAHASGTGYCYVCTVDPCICGEVIDLNPFDFVTPENALQVETYGLLENEGAKTPFPSFVPAGLTHLVSMHVKPIDTPASLLLTVGDDTPVYATVETRENILGETVSEQLSGWDIEKNPLWPKTIASIGSYLSGQEDHYPSVSVTNDVMTVSLGAGNGYTVYDAYGLIYTYNHWHSVTRIISGEFRAGQTYLFKATVGNIVFDASATSRSQALRLGICSSEGFDPTYSDAAIISYNWYNPTTGNRGPEPYPEYRGYTNYAKSVWLTWTPTRSYARARVAIGPVVTNDDGLSATGEKGAPFSFTVEDVELVELWGTEGTTQTSLMVPQATVDRTLDDWYDIPGSGFTASGRAGYPHRIFASLMARPDPTDSFYSLRKVFGLRFRVLRVDDGMVVANTHHDYRYVPSSAGVDDRDDQEWAAAPSAGTSALLAFDASFSGTSPGFLADYAPESYIVQFSLKLTEPYDAADLVDEYGTAWFWEKYSRDYIGVKNLRVVIDEQDPTGYAAIASQVHNENVIDNPDFLTDTTGWTTDNTGNPWSWRYPTREAYWVGPATIARVTNDGAWNENPNNGETFDASTCLQIYYSTSWDTGVYSVNAIDIEPGDLVSVSFWARWPGLYTRNRFQWSCSGPAGQDRVAGYSIYPNTYWTRYYASFTATSAYDALWFGMANWGPNAVVMRLSHVRVDVRRYRPHQDNFTSVAYTIPADMWSTVSATWTPVRSSPRPIAALTTNGTASSVFLIDEMRLTLSGMSLWADADIVDGTRTLSSITADGLLWKNMAGSVAADALMLVGYLREFSYLTCDAIIGWSWKDFYLRDSIDNAYDVSELLYTAKTYYPNWHDGYGFQYWEPDDYWVPPASVPYVLMGVVIDNTHAIGTPGGGVQYIREPGTRAVDDPLNPEGSTPDQTHWVKLILDTPKTVNLSTYGPPADAATAGPYTNWDSTLSLFRDTTPDGPERTLELVAFHDDIGNILDLPQSIRDELFWTITDDTTYVYASQLIGVGVPAGTYYIEVESDSSRSSLEGGVPPLAAYGWVVVRVWLHEAFLADAYIAHHFELDAVITKTPEAPLTADAILQAEMSGSITGDLEYV